MNDPFAAKQLQDPPQQGHEPKAPAVVAPAIGPGEAARRHWFIVVLMLAVCVGGAVAVGLTRQPVYEAETSLAVGRIDVSQPGALAGFTQATQSLATSYSRAITSASVVNRVASKLGQSPRNVRRHISATPVPQSPVFRVTATAPSQAAAVRTANLAASALQDYIRVLNSTNPDSGRLLRRFHTTAVRASIASSTARAARRRFAADPSSRNRAALADADAQLQALRLRLDAVSANYQTSQAGQASTSLVQPLTSATEANNDRLSKLEIYVFVGGVAGLLIGVGLATIRANRTVRRALAAER